MSSDYDLVKAVYAQAEQILNEWFEGRDFGINCDEDGEPSADFCELEERLHLPEHLQELVDVTAAGMHAMQRLEREFQIPFGLSFLSSLPTLVDGPRSSIQSVMYGGYLLGGVWKRGRRNRKYWVNAGFLAADDPIGAETAIRYLLAS